MWIPTALSLPRLALLLVALAGLRPTAALAAPKIGDNFLGGRVVDAHQVYVVVGYPDFETGVHLRLPGTKVEITPKVRFAYPLGGYSNFFSPLGVTLGADLRWQIVDGKGFSGALVASLPVHVGFGGGSVTAGLGLLHPGFMMTVPIADVIDLDFGLQFQDDLWFNGGGVAFIGAFPFIFGVETEVVENLAIGLRFEGGPAFTVGTGGAGLTGRVRAVTGIGWSF